MSTIIFLFPQFLSVLFTLLGDLGAFLRLRMLPALEKNAIILAQQRQLATFLERGIRPRRASLAEKVSLVLLSRFHQWRRSMVIVTPDTMLRWIRQYGNWRWVRFCKQRRSGRPPLSSQMQQLVRRLALENPTWSAGMIARTITLQLGAAIDTETVRKYMPSALRNGNRSQSWRTFLLNHSRAILACDFAVAYVPNLLTGRLRILYVLVVMEIGSRRILHTAVTEHPTATWTANQFRHGIPADAGYRFLIHDNDSIFSTACDAATRSIGIEPLRTPFRSPKANAFCERLIGTLRRECLDWIIPLGERHLASIVAEWAAHYNQARPHMALGPGIPEPPPHLPAPLLENRHQLPPRSTVASTPVLGGLHHEYRLLRDAA